MFNLTRIMRAPTGGPGAGGAATWDTRKHEWLSQLEAFYGLIEQWLEPYRVSGQLRYDYHPVSLLEELIGSYSARSLTLHFTGKHVLLRPVGAMLSDSRGRIDMEGPRGKARFVLIGSQWKILFRDGSKTCHEDFNEDNFLKALLELTSEL